MLENWIISYKGTYLIQKKWNDSYFIMNGKFIDQLIFLISILFNFLPSSARCRMCLYSLGTQLAISYLHICTYLLISYHTCDQFKFFHLLKLNLIYLTSIIV